MENKKSLFLNVVTSDIKESSVFLVFAGEKLLVKKIKPAMALLNFQIFQHI
ncbi:MAG: hypothetical protein QMC67_15030 [Candidatus Wallbacteria bacterium]